MHKTIGDLCVKVVFYFFRLNFNQYFLKDVVPNFSVLFFLFFNLDTSRMKITYMLAAGEEESTFAKNVESVVRNLVC